MGQTLNHERLEALTKETSADLVARVLTTVRVQVVQSIRELHRQVARGDFAGVLEHAHKIKASCESVGMENLAAAARQLEVAAQEENAQQVRAAFGAIPDLAKAGIAAANGFLAKKPD